MSQPTTDLITDTDTDTDPACPWGLQRQFTPPPGWSTDPIHLAYEYKWSTPDTVGQYLCADYGLGRGYRVMYDRNKCILMFEARRRYFLRSRIDQAVYEIVKLVRFEEILEDIRERGE